MMTQQPFNQLIFKTFMIVLTVLLLLLAAQVFAPNGLSTPIELPPFDVPAWLTGTSGGRA